MGISSLTQVCIALFPEAAIIFGEDILDKEPALCKSVTALHIVATGITSGPDLEQFRAIIAEPHHANLAAARQGRALAERDAKIEVIKRKRKKGEELTPEEEALHPAEIG